MSNLISIVANPELYTVMESTATGKFSVTRTSSVTGISSNVYIAENEAGITQWLRVHPRVDNPTFRVTSSPNIVEGVGDGQDWGKGSEFTFSSKQTDPELGGGAVKRALGSAVNRLLLTHMLKKALASGSPEGKHPDFTLKPTAVGTFGGKSEPSHTVVVHGDVDKKAIASAIADQFKQRAVATTDTAPVTGYVKENEESTMSNDAKIEESMFQTGQDNTLTGQSQLDYRNMLAGEIFGAAAFATQRPHSDVHEGANVVMDTQASEGMGVLRPIGAPSANMNEDSSFSKHMITLAKDLFRAGRMDEAAKIVDALGAPDTAAQKVLEAAVATDGAVDAKLTETLYQTAALLNTEK
jgi:hypothetical protein